MVRVFRYPLRIVARKAARLGIVWPFVYLCSRVITEVKSDTVSDLVSGLWQIGHWRATLFLGGAWGISEQRGKETMSTKRVRRRARKASDSSHVKSTINRQDKRLDKRRPLPRPKAPLTDEMADHVSRLRVQWGLS